MGSSIWTFDPMSRSNDNDGDETPSFYPRHHRSSKYELNSKIMVAAIVSLSAVVLLVLALHVYARFVLRRRARHRRAALHRLGLSVSRARAAEPAPPKRGLDASLIAALPLEPAPPGGGDCAVCLSALEPGAPARRLPGCSHVFHAECIDLWLAAQSTCPVCRAEVEPERHVIRPEPREGPAAPVLEAETTSGSSSGDAGKALTGNNGSNRFSLSFRRMLSRERSSSRVHQEAIEDLERQ